VIINLDEYKDKVLGCWTGKNIGGTLGAPFEGQREMNDASFYVQDLRGSPAPNDDLDLQLIWLSAAEDKGLFNLTPRRLAEYWMAYISGPWNEYGVCKANIANGLYPPLSGSCNNDTWKYSNGAWIRSEIWACLLPGMPDSAAEFAYLDACCDHCGEGIYAEVFTAAMQSAAFIVADVGKLVEIGLAKIPPDCRVARAVKLVRGLHAQGVDFKAAREAVVKDSEELGWFQAPGNIGFAMIGLLYGEGDFGRSVCLATNCGDDTDCSAATVGALLGIIGGRSSIPARWIEPIGESIKTIAINPFTRRVPNTLGELTERVVDLALASQRGTLRIASAPTSVPASYLAALTGGEAVARSVWSKSPYALVFDMPFGGLVVDYEDGPAVTPGEEKRLVLSLADPEFIEGVIHLDFLLPDDWKAMPGKSVSLSCRMHFHSQIKLALIPGALDAAFTYIPLEVRLAGRFNPVTLRVPFQLKGSVDHSPRLD